MAIDRSDIETALAQYLPRTVNFAETADLGERDVSTLFSRVSQAVLVALLLDPAAVFYVTYLAAKRLQEDVDLILATLTALQADEGVRALGNDPIARIEDLSKLGDARVDLLQISAAVAGGSFGTTGVARFQTDLREFLTDQVVPNSRTGGSREAVSVRVRTLMETLATAWASMLARKTLVLGILDAYTALDLKASVASMVIGSVQTRLADLEESLPSLTSEQQASLMEELLTDLAAADASVSTVSAASSVLGSVVIPVAEDGRTLPTYKKAIGRARIEASRPILRGTTGRVHVAPISKAETGASIDDADSDTLTPTFRDLTADFVVDGVAIDDVLTLADLGTSHRVTALTATDLTVTPEVPIGLTSVRYFITTEPPGTWFEDLSTSFWTTGVDGASGSVEVLAGADGIFPHEVKTSGTTLQNYKATGSDGVAMPYYSSGSAGIVGLSGFDFTEVGATFLTDGIEIGFELLLFPGPTIRIVTSIVDEENLTFSPTTTPAGPLTWALRHPSGEFDIDDAVFGEMLSHDFQDGDELIITAPPSIAGSHTFKSVVSSTRIRKYLAFASQETGVVWAVMPPDGVVYDHNANFLSAGILVGDVLVYDGDDYVIAVVEDHKLTLTTPFADPNVPIGGESYEIRSGSGKTNIFEQGSEDFFVAGVGALIGGEFGSLVLGDGREFSISRLDPDDPVYRLFFNVTIPGGDTEVDVDTTPLSWSVRAGLKSTSFTAESTTPFAGVPEGTLMSFWYDDPANAVRSEISSVIADDEVTLSAGISSDEQDVPYAIYHPVRPGLELVAAGHRSIIEDIVDGRMKLTSPLPQAVGIGLDYFVVEPGTLRRTKRLVDPTGAASYDAVNGFGAELVGNTVELFLLRQRKAQITNVFSSDGSAFNDGIELSLRGDLGKRRFPYRLRSAAAGFTDEMRTESVGTPLLGDYLSVWGEGTRVIQSSVTDAPDEVYTVDKTLPSGLVDKAFVVTRSGSEDYGRWLLFESLVSALSFSMNTQAARIRVAEALIDGGDVRTSVTSGSSMTTVDDGDGDTDTPSLTDATATFVASSVGKWDVLRLTTPGGDVDVYVSAVVSETEISVTPEVATSLTITSWVVERNSVSGSLQSLETFRTEAQALADLTVAYDVTPNTNVRRIIDVLVDQRLDRAAVLLRQGALEDFVELELEDASYTGRAKAAAQTVGRTVVETQETQDNIAGRDPTTGLVSPSTSLASSSATLQSAAKSHSALADGVEQFAGDDRTQGLSRASLEEMRNRAIYVLVGDVESSYVNDQDPTLPWIAQTGSEKSKVEKRAADLLAAIDYIKSNPDDYENPEVT